MATAYVSPTGSAAYPGTVGAPTSLTTALSSAGAGDIVYLAPGSYRGTFTLGVSGTAGNTIQFIGDPLATQNIAGIAPGIVRITNYLVDNVNPTDAVLFTFTSRNYWSFSNIYFDTLRSSSSSYAFTLATCTNWSFEKCVFVSKVSRGFIITTTANVAQNASFNKCVFNIASYSVDLNGANHTGNYNLNMSFTDCITFSTLIQTYNGSPGNNTNAGGISIYNITAIAGFTTQLYQSNTTHPTTVYNSVCINMTGGITLLSQVSGALIENYNLVSGSIVGVTQGTNSLYTGNIGLDYGYSAIVGLPAPSVNGPYLGSRLLGAGTATGAPATDIDGVTWYQSLVGMGAYTYAARNNVIGFVNQPAPNTITIAPGSTSQSIELFLGVTGLTASTSGLSAYYNRTRTADVQIPLVARTIAQAWTAGGFAEVNASTMPGVYRLDIPNEALASGVDDVTIVVRGASGTNGAVMSIKLSSGGLTSTQTAQAVWNALTSSHTTHGTFGWNSLRADAPSKEGLVTLHQSGGTSRVDADVHAIKNDTDAATYLKGALLHDGTGYVDADVVRISTSTAAANELEGALLHNGTDYIDSNLLSGNSTRVFVGRFDLRQTGSDDVDTIEVFTTDTPSFELQLTDGDGNEVPVTGATLGLRILDVASTVVETGTPTVEYGTGGIVRWTGPGTYLAIGCPVGMYRLFIDRTVSGTTTTFGPLQIKVQAQ